MAYRSILASQDSRGVLTVSINRPDIRNAFNEVVIEELGTVFSREAIDPSVRVVVLRGEGAVFCAGGDLNWMKKAVDFDFSANLADTRKLTRMFATLNECAKPVIGAIHGAAIGGGVGLVSICDIAVASAETVFSLSEVKLGIVPACIGPFVVAKIGASQARRFFMSAERFTAAQAKEVGLVHEVEADPKAVHAKVEAIASNILQCSPNAMKVAKELVLNLSWPEKRAALSDPFESVAETLANLRITEEAQDGVRAFLEKRKPKWLSK